MHPKRGHFPSITAKILVNCLTRRTRGERGDEARFQIFLRGWMHAFRQQALRIEFRECHAFGIYCWIGLNYQLLKSVALEQRGLGTTTEVSAAQVR